MPEPARSAQYGGNEVVLVVEDEEAVRSIVCRGLRQLGYHVLEAKNGEDALTVLQEYHAPAHVVVTDMVMPEMGGAQLIRMLHAWYPDLKVVFVSAYSREMIEAKGVLYPGSRYLPKPFSIFALAKTIREILDSGSEKTS
jgi:two-component system, cell cycle sensor histidine kinase and response regulator CckA